MRSAASAKNWAWYKKKLPNIREAMVNQADMGGGDAVYFIASLNAAIIQTKNLGAKRHS